MPALGTAPNSYSTQHWMTTCGAVNNATEAETLSFGFIARSLRIVNTCADVLFFSLGAEPATTGHSYIAGSGGVFQNEGSLAIESLSLKTTSTSTTGGLPTARPRVSVAAWSA